MAEKFISVSSILKEYGLLIINALKNNLAESKHNASYVLSQSISFGVKIFGNTYTMEIQMENYWRWVEYGRKAGKFPPLDPIIKWTAQKGEFSINEAARSFGRKSRKIDRTAIRRQLAFLIARKISKKGTPPTRFASKVLGQPFIDRGELTGPLWDNLRNDLTNQIGKQIIIQVTGFRN